MPTIDWHTRSSRIVSRKQRPSLHRESVEEFAVWWRARQEAREQAEADRLQAQESKRNRAPAWVLDRGLTVEDVQAALGISNGHVSYLCRVGKLEGYVYNRRRYVHPDSVQALLDERETWVSQDVAAEIAGCHASTIQKAARDGRIESREVKHRAMQSISRASAEAFGQSLRRQREERRTRRPKSAPPDDGHVYLDTDTVAIMLGVSGNRVRQLSSAGRLPSVDRTVRRWYRRDHVEQIAAARALRAVANRSASA